MAYVDAGASDLEDDDEFALVDCVNESYLPVMQDLLPPGRAWGGARRPGSVFARFLTGLALEFSRVERRGRELLVEYHPGEAFELLEDWERVLGLPRCPPQGELTLEERRQAAWDAFLGLLESPSKAFFTQLGIDLGFADLVITLYGGDLFRCNSRCNDFLYGPGFAFVWKVSATSLGEASDALLKCVFNFWKPLHTIIWWDLTP